MSDVDPGVSSTPTDSNPDTPLSPMEQAVVANDFPAFRAANRGESKPSTSPPASSAAPPEEPAASTDALPKPASEPAKAANSAELRVPELLADRAAERQRAERAERELAELKAKQSPDGTPADSSPATTAAPTFPDYDAYLVEHPGTSYESYLDARADYRADQRFQQQQAAAEIGQRITASQARVNEAIQADPTFATRISAEVQALKPIEALKPGETPTAMHLIASEVIKSPITPVLMLHFSEHPEDLQRLAAIPSPYDCIREFGKLEGRLSVTQPPAASASTPAPKHVTDAPEPPTTLGSKPAAPGDPIRAAVASGDFTSYQRAKRAALAAHHR